MKTIQKKVNYLIMSNSRCSNCDKLLKVNAESKGHKKCYMCFKTLKNKNKNKILEKNGS